MGDFFMKKNFIKIFSIFALFLAIFSFFLVKNTQKVCAMENSLGGVITIGEAKISLKADMARVTATITETNNELSKAKDITFDKYTQAKEKLANFGVEEKDINLNYFSTYPTYDNTFERNLVGYKATLCFEFLLDGLENIKPAIDTLNEIGITNINSVDYQIKEYASEYNNLLKSAIENATEKAKLMLGKESVEIKQIVEQETYNSCSLYKCYYDTQSLSDFDNQVEICAKVKVIFE